MKNFSAEWYAEVNQIIKSKHIFDMDLRELKLFRDACADTMFEKSIRKEKYFAYYLKLKEVDFLIQNYDDPFVRHVVSHLL